MAQNRLRLIYFSLEHSEIKSIDLNLKKVLLLSVCAFLAVLLVALGFITLFTNIYHNYRIASLQKENLILNAQIRRIQSRMAQVQEQLKELEQRDDNLRVLAELPKLDEDFRSVGVGGSVKNHDYILGGFSSQSLKKTYSILEDLDKLEREILLELESYEEIERALKTQRERIRHTPSIRPVKRGWLTSKFGWRRDPYLDEVRHHDGIDIAAEEGTPVYAPADGVVKIASKFSQRGKGYGLYVIIDHGFGIETIFAHLSKISVREGQKVKRWDKIGEVGNTGRAMGYHLHYEVRVNGKPMDPFAFIFDW